jgi:hypothetical protein
LLGEQVGLVATDVGKRDIQVTTAAQTAKVQFGDAMADEIKIEGALMI